MSAIQFSVEMARATYEGRKRQTRRIVSLNEAGRVRLGTRQWHPDDPGAVLGCPYGKAGDYLSKRWTDDLRPIAGEELDDAIDAEMAGRGES